MPKKCQMFNLQLMHSRAKCRYLTPRDESLSLSTDPEEAARLVAVTRLNVTTGKACRPPVSDAKSLF